MKDKKAKLKSNEDAFGVEAPRIFQIASILIETMAINNIGKNESLPALAHVMGTALGQCISRKGLNDVIKALNDLTLLIAINAMENREN